MNKRIVVVGAALTLMGSLAACSSSGGSGGTQSSAGTTNTVSSTGSSAPAGSSAPSGGLQLTKSANPTTVVLATTPGDTLDGLKKNIGQPFESATGNKMTYITPPDSAKIAAMESAGKVVWDVATIDPSFVNANCGKYFEKIDTSLYSNLDKYPAGAVTPCMVPGYAVSKIFSYNTDKFKTDPPTSIKDFFDTKKYPGKRLIVDGAGGGLYEAALVASGVDPKDLYPLDISRAEKEMDKIKNDLMIVPTYAAAQQALTTGQEAMTIMVTARTITSYEHGAHLAPVWNYTSYSPTGFAVLKDAPHLEAAQQFTAFVDSRDVVIRHCAANGFAPIDPDIKASDIPYSDSQRKFNPFEGDRGTVTLQDPTWYSENGNKLTASYTKWKVS